MPLAMYQDGLLFDGATLFLSLSLLHSCCVVCCCVCILLLLFALRIDFACAKNARRAISGNGMYLIPKYANRCRTRQMIPREAMVSNVTSRACARSVWKCPSIDWAMQGSKMVMFTSKLRRAERLRSTETENNTHTHTHTQRRYEWVSAGETDNKDGHRSTAPHCAPVWFSHRSQLKLPMLL